MYFFSFKKNNRHAFGAVFASVFFISIFFAAFITKANLISFLRTAISVENTEKYELKQPVVLNFSLPLLAKITEKSIKVSPSQVLNFKWENKNRKLIIMPADSWLPGERYSLSVSGRNIFLFDFNKVISFSTEAYPAVVNVYPENEAKNIAVDIEEPISFYFDKSLENYDLMFTMNPDKNLNFILSDDKKTVKLIAENNFDWQTRYEILVSIKLKQQDAQYFQKAGSVVFTTAFPPAERSSDPQVMLEEAKLYTKPAIAAGKYIDISLKYQNMVIFEEGEALDAYRVSTGKRGMETPQGTFKIYNKTPRAWSKKYALFMPYWMAFLPSGEMGIHELPEWPGGYKEGANHLGIPVSHGCIRLGIGPAKRVYEWAEIGTPVVIHY